MANNRREVLKKIALSTAAVGVAATHPVSAKAAKVINDCDCLYPNQGPKAEYFTNAIVHTHDRGKVMFYKDLLADKVVMINFMSIASEEVYQSTKKLVSVQEILGGRLGNDYFLYSITTDPVNDTSQRLKEFAGSHGVRAGWSFLTGTEEVINGIKQRFFYRDLNKPHHLDSEQDCSQGLMRYGNERVGLWGSVPHSSPSDWIAKRLEWVSGNKTAHSTPKRGGPYAIVKGKPWLYDSGNYSI